jgi:hypothetical protein
VDQAAFDFDLKLTDEERAVYGLLRQGRARALSARDLSLRTGQSDKQIRETVRSLIMERGIVVASAVDDPPGFFIAETPEEVINATRSLRHRGIMILVRAARLQKSSLELVFNQGCLELEREGER